MTTKTKPRKPTVRKIKLKEINQIPIKTPKTLTKPSEKFLVKPEFRYEPHILKLLEIQGFYELWISRLPHYNTYEEAYESAEVFFESCYGKRRFAGYDSFRSSVSQWLKKRNDNKN